MCEARPKVEKLLENLLQSELEQLGIKIQMIAPKSKYRDVYGVGKIDDSIANLVELLNANGYITLASCSGLKSEHENIDISSGYISFDLEKTGKKIKSLQAIARELNIKFDEEGKCFFRPAITLRITENESCDLNVLWNRFYLAILRVLINDNKLHL